MDREYAEQEDRERPPPRDKEGPELRIPLRGTRRSVPTGIRREGEPSQGIKPQPGEGTPLRGTRGGTTLIGLIWGGSPKGTKVGQGKKGAQGLRVARCPRP